MIIVNTPWFIKIVYNIAKAWIDEKTRAKMEFHGSDYIDALLEHIDDHQIPKYLGGKNETPLKGDNGPWNDWETVNPYGNPGEITGVRRKNDPNGHVFTP